eukprot:CFRG1208T1
MAGLMWVESGVGGAEDQLMKGLNMVARRQGKPSGMSSSIVPPAYVDMVAASSQRDELSDILGELLAGSDSLLHDLKFPFGTLDIQDQKSSTTLTSTNTNKSKQSGSTQEFGNSANFQMSIRDDTCTYPTFDDGVITEPGLFTSLLDLNMHPTTQSKIPTFQLNAPCTLNSPSSTHVPISPRLPFNSSNTAQTTPTTRNSSPYYSPAQSPGPQRNLHSIFGSMDDTNFLTEFTGIAANQQTKASSTLSSRSLDFLTPSQDNHGDQQVNQHEMKHSRSSSELPVHSTSIDSLPNLLVDYNFGGFRIGEVNSRESNENGDKHNSSNVGHINSAATGHCRTRDEDKTLNGSNVPCSQQRILTPHLISMLRASSMPQGSSTNIDIDMDESMDEESFATSDAKNLVSIKNGNAGEQNGASSLYNTWLEARTVNLKGKRQEELGMVKPDDKGDNFGCVSYNFAHGVQPVHSHESPLKWGSFANNYAMDFQQINGMHSVPHVSASCAMSSFSTDGLVLPNIKGTMSYTSSESLPHSSNTTPKCRRPRHRQLSHEHGRPHLGPIHITKRLEADDDAAGFASLSINDLTLRPAVRVTLQSGDLWGELYRETNEMITSARGRQMFPVIKLDVEGLIPKTLYVCSLYFFCEDNSNTTWRWCRIDNRWVQKRKGRDNCMSSNRQNVHDTSEVTYNHPDGVATGETWCSKPVTFDKLRICNRPDDQGRVYLKSFHKYTPILYFEEVKKTNEKQQVDSKVANESVLRFPLPLASFITATTYHNKNVAKLKILANPMAKSQVKKYEHDCDGSIPVSSEELLQIF